MAFYLYVKGYSSETTLVDLVIYFQSKESGGGDIDEEKCRFKKDEALIAFDEEEDLQNVLKHDHHVFKGCTLTISCEPSKTKPKPAPRRQKPQENMNTRQLWNEPSVGEVRTVIVSGIYSNTTDDSLKMFFENWRRSGGGKIENYQRIEPNVAHITFNSAEMASNVLKKKPQVDGYTLQLKARPPELILPQEKDKLYIENIDPKTTQDSLRNYVEVITDLTVANLEFGKNRNALITLTEEPENMDEIRERSKNKPLEGAVLSITNPPVCNSILVAGISSNTTKEAIELKFENPKTGGGKLYGEVNYQKEKEEAIVSFYDPNVVTRSLGVEEHILNDSVLSLRPFYPFMEENENATRENERLITVKPDVMDYVNKTQENEFLKRFGFPVTRMTYVEQKEELTVTTEASKCTQETFTAVENYFSQFTVKEIQISEKLWERSADALKKCVAAATKDFKEEAVAEIDELSIKIIGKENVVDKHYNAVKTKIQELEEQLNIETIEATSLDRNKLILFLSHGFEERLKSKFNVEVTIYPQKEKIEIQGPKDQVASAKAQLYEELVHVKEDYIELNEREKDFLESGGLDSLNDGLKEQNIQAMIYFDPSKPNRANVQVYNNKTEAVHEYLSEHMHGENLSVDDDSLSLLKSNKWEDFKEALATDHKVRIVVNNSQEIWLTGKKSEVNKADEKLKEFMRHNTIVSVSIKVGEGTASYLSTVLKEDVTKIEKKLEEQQVRVKLKEKGEFLVYGTKEGVENAKRMMEDIARSLAVKKISIHKPRTREYLQSEAGILSLDGIKARHHCTVRWTNENEQRPIQITSASKPRQIRPSSTLLCSYETPQKFLLKVYQADITTHNCEVIVNAANGELKHIGGVAGKILEVGGKEIQEDCDKQVKNSGRLYDGECYSGIPGKLPCKRLIHAVGPRWDKENHVKHKQILKLACTKTLEEAKTYRTIAFPAIGSGVFGVPKDVCASTMIEAAIDFSLESHSRCALKEIHFVNIDSQTAQTFVKHFKQQFSRKTTFIDNQAGARRSTFIQDEDSSPRRPIPSEILQLPKSTPNCITTRRQTRISVVVGDLSTHKADVIVNTASGNLNLDTNPCSSAISKEAGPALQRECKQIGKLNVGEIAVTGVGKLQCKNVYHVRCTEWGRKGVEVLRHIIKSCLNKSHSRGMTSIAFPAIGTGVLGFPHQITAEICFEEAKEFEKRKPNSPVKDIRFVVYHQDQASIKAFQEELANQPEWEGGMTKAPSRKDKRKPLTNSSPSDRAEKERRDEICIEIDNTEIQVVQGDITKETTDVIAHLSNTELSMDGGVANAIKRAGGNEIEEECLNKRIRNCGVVLTKAGRLRVNYIAHMAAPNSPSLNEIDKSIFNCLKEVASRGCKSISFPAVGTGVLQGSAEKSAKTMLETIIRFLQAGAGPLKTVRIVINDENILEAFSTVVKQFLQEESSGILKKVWNYLWKSDPGTNIKEKAMSDQDKPELFLEICAKDHHTLNQVEKTINQLMDDQKKNKLIEDDDIEKLSRSQIAKIEMKGKSLEVKLTIEKSINRIKLFGHVDDISKVELEVRLILNNVKLEEKEKENAEMVSQLGVKWYWEDTNGSDQVEYEKHINALIQKAFMKKEKSVLFTLEEGQCEITFDKMTEKNLDTNQVTKVTKIDLKADISVPEYWDQQPKDRSGIDKPVHVVPLDIRNLRHKNEYEKVSDGFLQTAKGHTILEVQRIQNPTLFKLYALKKRSMDEQTASNETYLYHGTRADRVLTINKEGLNRSYAGGANGILYGKGVYFARDAITSVNYTSPDSAGSRAMYVARVAIGEYTTGNQSMIVPPKKGNGNESYDSVVDNPNNPSIYVLFYDAQYYPEYLITFQ